MNPLYKNLYSYLEFRKWWAIKLNNRPTKLYDFNTGKMMTLEKRFIRELPKVQDLFDFVTSLEADVVVKRTDKYFITISGKINETSSDGEDLIETFINTIMAYLNIKFNYEGVK